MLLPSQFKDIGHFAQFSLSVEEVRIDGKDIGAAEIPISYDEFGSPVLSFGEFFSPTFNMFNSEVQVKYKRESEPWPIIITKQHFNSEQAKPTVEGRLARQPLVLEDAPNSERFEAILLSAPSFLCAPVTLYDKNGSKFELEVFKLEEGGACLIRSDLKLDASNPLMPLNTLLDFLTFTKGSHCGLGNLFAYDDNDEVAFRLLGFSSSDPSKRQTNWFDIEIQRDLPEIFSMFSQATVEPLTRMALRQTINFYRASNASRNVSIEMSIIAAHSALEAIVNFILENRGGWSKNMMSNRDIAFSDKFRAAAKHFGIHDQLLSQSPELSTFSNQNNGIDAFEIISRFRNKLVHQDKKIIHTGMQLHETWQLAQWLVEILIFGVIGYHGNIIDRRIYKGWRGTTCEIPLART